MAKGYNGNRPGPYWKEALKGEAVPKRGARRSGDDEDEGQPQRGGGAKGAKGGQGGKAAKGAKPSTHPLRKHAGQGGRPEAGQAAGGRGRQEAQPRGERAPRGGGPVWGQRQGGATTGEGAPRRERRAPRPRPGKPAPVAVDEDGVAVPAVPAVPRLDGSGQVYITLVQWLKRSATSGTGAEGKHTVRAGGILVNGTEELRPGRKLHAGDTVTIAGKTQTVTL
jgi:ribosome-associated protein YbcJ (S4-like RNA binding protein)